MPNPNNQNNNNNNNRVVANKAGRPPRQQQIAQTQQHFPPALPMPQQVAGEQIEKKLVGVEPTMLTGIEPVWLQYRVDGMVIWEYDQNNPNRLRIQKRMYGKDPQLVPIDLNEYLERINKNKT